jgi:multidrug efflux system outer membrane protein
VNSATAMPASPLRLLGLALATALAATGCAVGPDYREPKPTLDASFVNAPGGANATAAAADIAAFWRGFGDAELSALIERGLAVNGDVRIAQGRLQESRATLQGARAELLPNIGVSADAGRALTPEYLLPGASRSQRTTSFYDAGFTANWELDFFGRNRRASESAAAQVDASQAGVHAAQTIVAAEIARNYLELRGLQQRLQVARDSIVNQRETLRLTSARLEVGRGTRLDVARAQSQLDSTEALLPALQVAADRTAYRIATLAAEPLRDVATRLATPRLLPTLPVTDLSALPLGTPEQLLRRRPDLVQSERLLAAATANIGVATADLFPRVSLTGLIGFASGRLTSLGDGNSQQYSLGAGLTWPLLDFGRVRSRIAASEARALQALAGYEQTVATALEETEGALSQFSHSAEQTDKLASAARNADDAARLSKLRFDAGAVDFLIVLDAERQSLAARDALVLSQVGQATALVSVYRALGGGWSVPVSAAVAGASPGAAPSQW